MRQRRLPGSWVKKLALRSHVVASILKQTDVLQIVEDHQAMWLSANSDAERARILMRFRRQLALAAANFTGFETTIHGAVLTLSDPLNGGALILAGVILMWVAGKGAG